MSQDQRKSRRYEISHLTLPDGIDILLLLYNREDYVPFDEIYSKLGYSSGSKSNLMGCLREELIRGLIEKRVSKDSSFYKITPKGRSVIEKLHELAKVLEV